MKIMTLIQDTHPGLLAEVTDLLARNDVDIADFNGQVVGRTAVITLHATPYKTVFRLLSDAGYHVYASETLLLKLEQRPGALARLSRRLADAGVNVRGLHIIRKEDDSCLVALETVDRGVARDVLADCLVG